jgi:hypothetical protein
VGTLAWASYLSKKLKILEGLVDVGLAGSCHLNAKKIAARQACEQLVVEYPD